MQASNKILAMTKYLHIFSLKWQSGFVYRTSLFLWRFRQLLSTVMALTIWTVLFSNTSTLFQYNRNQMISYIFLVNILQSLILATSLNSLAGTVYSGDLSNILTKPVNLFLNFLSEDLADKAKNVFFIILETIFLYFIFQPAITVPTMSILGLFLLWSLAALLLHFFVQLIFGSMGFWSPDTWGPRFLFFMMVDFTAGKLYPLDILPSSLQRLLSFTPFPYFSFWQIQLFLERLNNQQIIFHSLVLLFWLVITGSAARYLWRKGLRQYAAAGR